MSGPLRLQVQAGGAFLSRVNVLRVMRPAQGFQVRILAPARLGHEAVALRCARPEARTARAPSRRPNRDRRVARTQPPQPRGSAVEPRRPGAASNPPQPASGAGRRLGRPSTPAGSTPPLRPAPEFVALTGSRCVGRA